MKLTLLSKQEYVILTLPKKCAGHYWVRGRGIDGKMMDIVSVDALRMEGNGDDAQWMIKSNRRFKILDKDSNILPTAEINALGQYRIQSADGRLKFILFAEPLSVDRKQYCGYELPDAAAVLSVGREASNHICYDHPFVSSHHAELKISAEGISVRDLDSTNGTYVNGKRVQQQMLGTGDVVYILGLQIVVTARRIFLNNPDGKVRVLSRDLKVYHAPACEEMPANDEEADEFEDVPCEYYYRAPRFKHDVDEYELKVDAPPVNQNNDELPMIMMIGPSMTMGMAAAASGTYTVVNAVGRGDVTSAIPSIVMCVSMLLGTMMWPLITKTYQKRLRRRKEAKRQETYQAYLVNLEGMVAQEISRQERLLRDNDVDISSCINHILEAEPQIWERTPKHTDFLSLRLGSGSLPLKANIQYPERKFMMEQDNLTEMMYQFGETKRQLMNVPICLPVAERFISGLYADSSILFAYAKSLMIRIAALHSYDEVKLVLIYDEHCNADFSFARWLPHTMNDERTVRYIATNFEEAKALSYTLDTVIEYRKELSDSKLEEESPYFVIFCLDKALASKAECVRRILGHKKNLKISVVSMFERLVDLPKECTAVVNVHKDGEGSLTFIGDVSDPPIPFRADALRQMDMGRIAGVLANTFVDIGDAGFVFPKKYTFFEMLDIGMVSHLNLMENWAANDPTKSLAAAVGIDKYGEIFQLDLHESAHGPHGLVAGMTGSGKSEFIITYILSMALNYHPYEVAFILIDYKGGGMAKSFENIPHTAGVITNLDGNGIQRSLLSLRSELQRREQIFRDTSQHHNVSNIDIYKYQGLYREGKVSEPLPHLFIISDEFAELKDDQSEFMSELTSAARVGRSLGVHLILATQKPGGVVDEQIRSNASFRLCLKVQDSGDSVEMLGRPDAAALVDKGRFYLRVGYNELFEIGQSAWAGAPYYPSSRVIKDRDDAVSVINTNGSVIAEANIDRFAMIRDPKKQLDVLTNHISKVCEEEQIIRWKMWLDPIPERIYVDELAEKYGGPDEDGLDLNHRFVLNPIVGELDVPARQSQNVLCVPITEEGNVIVYGSAGNGKAMFVEAMCYSLMRWHTPQEVNLYLMDFDAGTMTAFAESPHVGDVILAHETEKVNNLLKLMMGKLESRKKLLSGFGGSMVQYNQQAEKPQPSLVVVIHNFAAFTELFEERMGEISYLTREGTKYGIYFVLTCTGVNNVRLNLLQNFKLLYCLQLNNADDYSTVVGKTGKMLPDKYKGRGLVRLDAKTLLEFQTACITREELPYPFIRMFSKKLAQQYSGKKAVGVPVLPQKVSEQFILPYIIRGRLDRVPIGVEKVTLDVFYYDFTAGVVSMVLSLGQEWQKFTDVLAKCIALHCDIKTILLAPMGKESGLMAEQREMLQVHTGMESCVKAASEIYELVLKRNNEYKDRLSEGRELPEYEPVVVMIQSISLLTNILGSYQSSEWDATADDDTPLNRLQLAIEKCHREYHVYFIVAENIHDLTPMTSESWYKAHINGNHGIWVGDGIETQYRLNVSKKPDSYSQSIGSDFGYAVNNAAAILMKLLQ